MTLNRAKCKEIVFTENRRRQPASLPAPLADIKQVTSLKMLGVTVTNHLSLSEHVREIEGVQVCADQARTQNPDKSRHVYDVCGKPADSL